MPLDAQAAREAYESWAKSQITSISADRLEIAKFFFTASTTSLGFFIALWQFFRKETHLGCIDVSALVLLGSSVLWSMAIFWPMTHDFSDPIGLYEQHRQTLKRIKKEALAWAILWASGGLVALIATFSK